MGAEVVDSIVANLEVRYQQYVEGFDKATAAHGKFKKSVDNLQAFDLQAGAAKYRQGAQAIANAEEQSSEKIKRIRKARTVEVTRADEAEVASAKAAAKAKADAEIAEATRSARLRAVAERAASRQGVVPATGGRIGATVPREGTGQRPIPAAVLNGGGSAEAVAEAEVNHLLADRFDLQQRIRVAAGSEKQALQDQAAYLLRINTYKRAGLSEDEAILRAEKEMLVVSAGRAAEDRKKATSNITNFARGAGVGRFAGAGTAAGITGIATVTAIGVGTEVIASAVAYGKAIQNLSEQLGIATGDLQAYQQIARETGVSTENLSSAFGQFASNLGRAQQGSQEQAKVFKALGIDIKDFSSAGDALPTVINRISQLKDPLSRAAIETRLFGEEGRKLDPLLSGGAARVSELAASLQETGRALSAKEIQELGDTSRKLQEVKNELSVDFARVVAGNAGAIIRLAQSFATLTESVIGTIGRLREFVAQKIVADKIGSQSYQDRTRADLLASPTGRQTLLQQNGNALKANRLSGADPTATIRINGQDVTNTPAAAAVRTQAQAAERKRLLAERREILTAGNVKPEPVTPAVQAGTVNASLLRTLGAPKPPKGKSADQLAREAEQRERQFNDQVASANADYLRAQEQMTGSVDQRADIEKQLLETAYKTRLLDIDSQRNRNVLAGADAKLEDARAAELKAAEKKAHDANSAAIEQDRRLDKERALTAATDSLLDVQNTLLSAQAALASTAKDRRTAMLAVVDNEQARETNRLAGIINNSKPGDPAQAQALTDFQSVQSRYDAQRRGVIDQTLSPLDQYKKDLHSATDDTSAAIQGVEVNALQGLEDSLSRSIGKVLGLKGAFGDLFGSVLSDIAKIELKKGILALLGGSGGSGGGGGIGKLIGSVGSLFSHHAGGGNVVGGVPIEVGENGREVFVPSQSGKIVPNNARVATPGGGTVLHQTFNVDASGVNPEGFAGGIISAVRHETTQAIRASSSAVLDATPARVNRVSVLGG